MIVLKPTNRLIVSLSMWCIVDLDHVEILSDKRHVAALQDVDSIYVCGGKSVHASSFVNLCIA